jgi:inosine/xanthosine triphosphatase
VADFGVGIEAGLLRCEALKAYFDVQFCAIVDREGKVTVGHGAGFVYPPRVLRAVLEEGRTVGEAMAELSKIPDIGKRMGAIGYLSRGLLDRTQLTEQAVLMALLPRLRPELYEPEGSPASGVPPDPEP